ncbi:MAG: acetyl-CoA hydrolase/transferase C-terminal domain-containing protein [Eubacteriales bacterium]|nr:acetyl-CoA hydrolase/transferase C-terminal domain-containing protein [Eubacteriales bacterium]
MNKNVSVADLKGKSIPEREKALIGIADPDFRGQLMKEPKVNRLI